MHFLPKRMLTRLMLLTCLVLMGAIALNAFFTYREQSRIARSSSEKQALAIARSLAISSIDYLVTNQIDGLDALLLASIDFQDVMELRVSNETGRVLSHFTRKNRPDPIRVFDPSTDLLPLPSAADSKVLLEVIEGRPHLVAWAPVESGVRLGWIRVDLSTNTVDALSTSMLNSTLKASVLAIFLGSLLIFIFLRGPILALERARKFALSLNRSDGAQLPFIPGPIEIEDLERALNGASSDLHTNRLELANTIEQLRLQEVGLTKSNLQLDAIFTLSPDGMVTFNTQGIVDYANPSFLKMVGWLKNDLIGLDALAFDQKLRLACDSEQPFEGIDALDGLNADSTNPTEQCQLITLSGTEKRILEIKKRNAQDSAVSFILYFRDITYETEVDRIKTEFLSHAAHELRTPMTSIFGYSEVLLSMDIDPETQRELLDIIHRQSGALVKIINELLDLARIDERGSLDLHLQRLDLVGLTRSLIADMQLDTDKWPVLFNTPAPVMNVLADAGKMRQIIINVLGNAHKYSPQGGPIRVSCIEELGMVGIEVSDQGLGLTPEQLTQIGQRFWRADKSGNIPGSGLGVGIVKAILNLHGGHLQVQSQHGQGSSFTMWLPKAPALSAEPSPGA